jgi:hypothetical protein
MQKKLLLKFRFSFGQSSKLQGFKDILLHTTELSGKSRD